MQISAKIDVRAALERHSVRIANGRALILDRIALLVEVLAIVVNHEKQISGVSAWPPKKVVLVPA
jgi:hypothetical protein